MTTDRMGITGSVVVSLYAGERCIHRQQRSNLITTVGDIYYAAMAIAGVSPAAPAAPTLVTGMKLGTGTADTAKSGTGSALGVYLSGSNMAFDATYPLVATPASYVTYRCTWAAGVATAGAISEVALVTDAATNATSAEANTIARLSLASISKGAGNTLVVAWTHRFLGA